jgi:fucose permease
MGGGSLFRIAISAAPFLLPLMFQVGFGLNAFESGLLTLSVFAGNLSMKLVTTPVMRRFGFRPVLIVNGILAAVSLAVMSLISPTTPTWIVVAVLFASGLSRSLQFTALNTLSFADVPKAQMSGASALSSTLFQLTMGIGVALGAIALRLAEWMHGHGAQTVVPADFSIAFLIVGAVGLLGVADLFSLHRDAGAQVSGHARKG